VSLLKRIEGAGTAPPGGAVMPVNPGNAQVQRPARGPAPRAVNVSDDSALKMGAYFDLAADRFALPRPPRPRLGGSPGVSRLPPRRRGRTWIASRRCGVSRMVGTTTSPSCGRACSRS